MDSIQILDRESWFKILTEHSLDINHKRDYKAMYSSWWQAIVTDPSLMLIPIDDHQVHRGDAVFEAIKVVNSKIYLLNEHLDRLDRSAKSIGLTNPYERAKLIHVLEQTLAASGLAQAILRIFLSRGPGSFSPNPYDTLGTQLYVVVTKLQPVPESKLKKGVSAKLSKINPKEPWLAQIKSCNYLQNVLMKKEALDWNVDYTIGINAEGFITEGSTENIIVFTKNAELLKPKSETILLGTMMQRSFELAKKIPDIKSCLEKNITLQDLISAQEIMMVGTTLDVISVTEFEGNKISDGYPGAVSQQLRELLLKDQS